MDKTLSYSFRRRIPLSSDPAYAGESAFQEWLIIQRRQVWRPATDVYETDTALVIKVEIAGIDQEHLNISLEDHTLVVSGQRLDPVAKLGYQQMEISYGEFRTEVPLRWRLDLENMLVTYDAGFLLVTLPKVRSGHKVSVHGCSA